MRTYNKPLINRSFTFIGATSGKNIALYRSAEQSSQVSDYTPDFAVDGNENSNFQTLTCMRTNNENNPWWALDLGADEKIQKVSLIIQVRFVF